jgi:hypothetical protein
MKCQGVETYIRSIFSLMLMLEADNMYRKRVSLHQAYGFQSPKSCQPRLLPISCPISDDACAKGSSRSSSGHWMQCRGKSGSAFGSEGFLHPNVA